MADYTDYITQGALRRGLDPNMALHTVRTEGGTSGFDIGDSGTSFGPFQLHVAGTAPGTTASGLGDSFRRETGLDPSNPANVYHTIDYALDYAKAHGGFSPDIWHGLRTGSQEGVGVGEQRHGGTYVGVVRPEDGFSVGGALLLNNLLQQQRQAREAADQDTGNPLLNSIIQQSLGAQPSQPQAQPFDTRALQATPRPQLPQTEPELAQAQVPPAPPLQQIAAPSAPPAAAPTPSAPPVQPAPVPQTPVIQPDSRRQEAGMLPDIDWSKLGKTGNALLDSLLKIIPDPVRSTIDTDKQRQFQAGFGKAVGEDLRRLRDWAYPTAPQAPKPGTALERILSGIGDVPSARTDVEQAQTEQAQAQQPPMSIPERITEFGEQVLPYTGMGAVEEGGVVLGAGPIIRRGEPPPLSEVPKIPRIEGDRVTGGVPPEEHPQIGRSTALSPRVEPREAAVPGTAVQPAAGGGAGGGAGEPPIWRGGRAESSGPLAPKGDANESAPVKAMRLEAMHSVEDRLAKLWQQSEEYKNRVLRMVAGKPRFFRGPKEADLPHLTGNQKLQLEKYMEWQPGMPRVALDGPTLRMYNEFIKPALRQAAEDFAWLKSEGASAEREISDEQWEDLTQGYLHRMAANVGYERHPYEPFAGVKGIRRSTSSMKGRKFYVVQDQAGNRHIYRGDPPPYGSKLMDENGREVGEVRRATTEEIEANTDTRYLHDPVLATLSNMTQLHLARKNMELLNELIPKLKDMGLAATDARAARRLGLIESDVPSLRGTYFEKRIANTFNDFYRAPSIVNDQVRAMFSWIGAANRFAIAAMFTNPFGHIENVVSDYILSRGALWASPPATARMARSMRAAFSDVWKKSDFYRQVMHVGGAPMGMSNETRILYQLLFDKARNEMTRLPFMEEVARRAGWKNAKAMAYGIWNASQKFMWGVHDMLLMARVRELMEARPGLPLEAAVKQAERTIADYRVPASVGETSLKLSQPVARAASVIMQDRTLTVFGRYHYNKLRAIGNVIGDAMRAMRPGTSAAERLEAGGRLGAMLLFGTVLAEGFNYLAQEISGNKDASVHIPGALGLPNTAYRVAKDLVWKRDMGDAWFDTWSGLLSIISPQPMLADIIGLVTNKKPPFYKTTIRGDELPAWEQAVQVGTQLVGSMVPPLEELTDWRRFMSSTGRVSLPEPGARERAKRPHPLVERGQQKGFARQHPLVWRFMHPQEEAEPSAEAPVPPPPGARPNPRQQFLRDLQGR